MSILLLTSIMPYPAPTIWWRNSFIIIIIFVERIVTLRITIAIITIDAYRIMHTCSKNTFSITIYIQIYDNILVNRRSTTRTKPLNEYMSSIKVSTALMWKDKFIWVINYIRENIIIVKFVRSCFSSCFYQLHRLRKL
jgi:hypothetical protein